MSNAMSNAGHQGLLAAMAVGNPTNQTSHHLTLAQSGVGSAMGPQYPSIPMNFNLSDMDFPTNKRPRLFVENKPLQPLLIETNNMMEIKKVFIF